MQKLKNASKPTTADGLVVVDLSFRAIAADSGAAKILSRSGNGWVVPEELLSSLKTRTISELADAKARFRIGTTGYICRVSVLQPCAGSAGQPLLAMRLHRQIEATDTVLEIAEKYELTDREREALTGISMGLTCKEVAHQMNISPNTVKAFLRLIMIKMGVTRRSGIISKVLEYK